MYNAVVAKVATRPHPNADRLQLATVSGYQVVVGLDVADGTLGVFFPAEGRLSPRMAEENDLVRRKDPVTGKPAGGMFDANLRVRSQRLRGEKSEGFWTELSSLAWTGYDLSKLAEGDQFCELNGHEICAKYYTPATLRAMKGGTAATKRVNRYFAEHVDTKQLRYEIDRIPDGAIVYLTLKMHGTSQRVGYVLDEVVQPQGWLSRALRRKPKVTEEYRTLVGTRRVVLRDPEHKGFYGDDEDFRRHAIATLEGNLHQGEVLYGEIVGWTGSGAPIMTPQDTSQLSELQKQYGPKMVYKYGQPEGTCQFYVYRITRVNTEGVVTELSWPQVRARCGELGVAHVPDLAGPVVFRNTEIDRKALLELAEELAGGADPIDPSHIREGVVVRWEHAETSFLKFKSFEFGCLEGYLRVEDDFVDLEEIS